MAEGVAQGVGGDAFGVASPSKASVVKLKPLAVVPSEYQSDHLDLRVRGIPVSELTAEVPVIKLEFDNLPTVFGPATGEK